MKALGIPRTPEELTATWLTACLRRNSYLLDGEVTSLRSELLDPTKAVFGTLVRLHLSYSGNAQLLPSTMVVKLPSQNPDTVAIMRTNGGYEAETRFYEQLSGGIGLRVPQCYGSCFDDVTGRFVLLLEDLSPCRRADGTAALTARETTAVVKSLAASHALWWRGERLTGLSWLRPISADIDRFQARFPVAWPIVIEYLGVSVPREIGDKIARLIPQMGARLESQPITFLHLDVRRENLFFAGLDEDPVPIVIDWQNVRYGRGPAGLASFLALLPDRVRIEDELVRLYYAELRTAGVRDYTIDECFQDYWLGLLRRFVAPACVLATVAPNSTQGANILALLGTIGVASVAQYVDQL